MIEEIRRKRSLTEDYKEIVQILQSYISSLSSLKGDEKKASSGNKDKDDEYIEKNDDLQKKEKKGKKGDDKKDPGQGKERVYKSKRGGGVKKQTRNGNCDVSTILQGSIPRVEVTSVNLTKSISKVTDLQPLTPKLKN